MSKQKTTVNIAKNGLVPLFQIYYGKFFSSDMFEKEELFIALPTWKPNNAKDKTIHCVSITGTGSYNIEPDAQVTPVDVDIKYYPTPNFEYVKPGPGMG